MKITEDFIGNETKELTKTKIATILRWWGFNPDSYSTWGNARVDMNNILSGSSSSTISDRERASSFLSKINYINDTDTVISDTLFAANEPGVWYDPSDLSTLFQDAAGTLPVTGVEQPVGLMLDKSGRGNHASQPTATSRPVLSARVNLLTNTVFSGAVAGTPGVVPTGWSFNSVGGELVSANDGVIVFSVTNSRQIIGVNVTIPANTTQTWSVRIEENPDGLAFSQLFFAVNATESVVQYRANGVVVAVTGYIPAAGDVLTITLINGATQITPTFRIGVGTSSAVTGTAAFSRPDARVANNGVNLPPYQRVNTAADYDTVGFPHYLRFDGVDDWLSTNTITPGIDKVQVFAGVRKMSDAALGTVVELSAEASLNNGAMQLQSRNSASYAIGTRGTAAGNLYSTNMVFVSPITTVICARFNNAGSSFTEQLQFRANGSDMALTNALLAGTTSAGNYLAYPLYIGRRNGGALPFNGHIYGLIVRFGSNLPTATIGNTEKYINGLTKAY